MTILLNNYNRVSGPDIIIDLYCFVFCKNYIYLQSIESFIIITLGQNNNDNNNNIVKNKITK